MISFCVWWRPIVVGILFAGCSGAPSSEKSSTSPERDAGAAAGPSDAGAQPTPQLLYGPPDGLDGSAELPGLLSSLQIVTATWNGDTEDLRPSIATAFGPGLESSAWWTALSGYCVPSTTTCANATVTVGTSRIGDAPGVPFVDSATAQSTRTDSFARFIRDKSQPGTSTMDGGAKLPEPVTASTLYVFFLPLALPADAKGPGLQPGWAVTVDGTLSCGYHSATVAGTAGAEVAYVVVPRCHVAGQADVDVAIATAFREIADAVTDPFRAVGRIGFHNQLAPPAGFEVGDICSGTTGTANGIAGFSVPQIWSNGSMSCAP
jgi:hypothetical protein